MPALNRGFASLTAQSRRHVGNRSSLCVIFCRIVKGSPEVEIRGMKSRPNHKIYIRVLREMGPEKRLQKAFELSEFSRALLKEGLKGSHPSLGQNELNQLYLSRMEKARNRAD
jgi:hypothetical protein